MDPMAERETFRSSYQAKSATTIADMTMLTKRQELNGRRSYTGTFRAGQHEAPRVVSFSQTGSMPS